MKLPDSVQEIADVIGRERALYLIGQLPQSGTRSWRTCFYVPKRIKPDHLLVEILGWHDAMRMVRHFGGEILQTSNCNFLHRQFRAREIHRMNADGLSAKQIAAAVGITDRQVRNILAESPPEERQPVNDNDRGDVNEAVQA